MSPRAFPLFLGLLGLSSLAGAACGGKTVLITSSSGEDAGSEDDAGSPPVRDSAVPPVDTGTADHAIPIPCPSPTQLTPLGAPCDFAGTCPINLDTCDAGVGSPMGCVCLANEVQLPPGTGIACAVRTPPPATCPTGLVIGGACDFPGACSTDYCGPGDSVECACNEGIWACPGATCVPPPPPPPPSQCTQGAPCSDGTGCQSTEGECEISCMCTGGSYECSTACADPVDAGGPVPFCTGTCTGPCTGADGCGGIEICPCVNGASACVPVHC